MSYNPAPIANTSRSLSRNYVNGFGSTLIRTTPVSTLTSGLVTKVDVTSQLSVDEFVGLYNVDTPSSASGQVLDSGLMENITTSFSVGDPVYIDTTGALTNITPVVGVNGFLAGYYCVFIGVIVQNEFSPSQKDLKILIQKAGIL